MKTKNIVIRTADQISIWKLITKLFIWNIAKICVFQAVKAVYANSYQSKKSLKLLNNTPTIGFRQSLTCKNCQMVCRPYLWDKYQANASPLTLMTDLSNSYAMLQEKVLFVLTVLTVSHLFYKKFQKLNANRMKAFLRGIFEKSQILARYIFETSLRRHRIGIFFEICLGRLKDDTQKTSSFTCNWDIFKT